MPGEATSYGVAVLVAEHQLQQDSAAAVITSPSSTASSSHSSHPSMSPPLVQQTLQQQQQQTQPALPPTKDPGAAMGTGVRGMNICNPHAGAGSAYTAARRKQRALYAQQYK